MSASENELKKISDQRRSHSVGPGMLNSQQLQEDELFSPQFKTGRSMNDQSRNRMDASQLEGDVSQTKIKKRAITIASISDENNDEKIKQEMQEKIDLNQQIIDQMQKNAMAEADARPNSVTTDDCIENETVFKFMKYGQRVRHMKVMWLKTFTKAKAGSQILHFTSEITKKIQILGIRRGIDAEEAEEKVLPFILMPNSFLKTVWNLILIGLLIYTATYMPFSMCFIDSPSDTSQKFDQVVNILFTIDIFINFISAVDLENGTFVTKLDQIAKLYIKSWLAFDISSVLPVQWISLLIPKEEELQYISRSGQVIEAFKSDDGGNYNQLIRLVRLPRLYRMVKILRLLRVIKVLKKNKFIFKIQRILRVSPAITRMIQGLFTAVMVTHLFACFWFLAAKLNNLGPETWVWRLGLQDASLGTQYVWAMHWACQTITTVGYGDVKAKTKEELLLSFVWMLVGVGFYSFIIGNFSTIAASTSQLLQTVQIRVQGLQDLSRRAKMPFTVIKRIKQYVENNYQSLFSKDDEQSLIQTLPPSLRDEILRITYGEIIENIIFFKSMTDGEFLWKILPVLNSIKLEKQEVLYWKGDTSDEFYFISKGTIKLYNDQGNPFIKYSNGDMFGDSDALLDLPRDGKAQAITTVVLKSLQIKQFEKLFLNSEDTCLQMIVNARKKRDKHLMLMEKANERVRKKTLDPTLMGNLVKSINDEKRNKTEIQKTNKKDSDAILSASPKTNKSLGGFQRIGQFVKSLKEKNSSLTKTSDRRNSSQESPAETPHKEVKLGEIKKEPAIDSAVTSNKGGLPPMGSTENREKLKKRMIMTQKKKSAKELGRLRLQFDRLEQGSPIESSQDQRLGLSSPQEIMLTGLSSKFRDSKETLQTETHRSVGIKNDQSQPVRMADEIEITEEGDMANQNQLALRPLGIPLDSIHEEQMAISPRFKQQAKIKQSTLEDYVKRKRELDAIEEVKRLAQEGEQEDKVRVSVERNDFGVWIKKNYSQTNVLRNSIESKLSGNLKRSSFDLYFDEKDRLRDSDALNIEKQPRKTLLDKLVLNVFDKHKETIFKDYPALTKLNVPRIPIMTPKGKDIIMPTPFRESNAILQSSVENALREVRPSDSIVSMEHQSERTSIGKFSKRRASVSCSNPACKKYRQNASASPKSTHSKAIAKEKCPSCKQTGTLFPDNQSDAQPSLTFRDGLHSPVLGATGALQLKNKGPAFERARASYNSHMSPRKFKSKQSGQGSRRGSISEVSQTTSPKHVSTTPDLNKPHLLLNTKTTKKTRNMPQRRATSADFWSLQSSLKHRQSLEVASDKSKSQGIQNGGATDCEDIKKNILQLIQAHSTMQKAATATFNASLADVKIELNDNILMLNTKHPIDSKLVGLTGIEIIETLEMVHTQNLQARKTIWRIAEDHRQIIETQASVESGLDNIIEMIRKQNQLKNEIKSLPRPVIDENGKVIQKAIKSETLSLTMGKQVEPIQDFHGKQDGKNPKKQYLKAPKFNQVSHLNV